MDDKWSHFVDTRIHSFYPCAWPKDRELPAMQVFLTTIFFLMALVGCAHLFVGRIEGPYTFSLSMTFATVGGLACLGLAIAGQSSKPGIGYVMTTLAAFALFPLLLVANFYLGLAIGYEV